MDRYPAIIYVGAAILGKVGGGMIMTDRLVEEVFQSPRWLTQAVEGWLALGGDFSGVRLAPDPPLSQSLTNAAR